MAMKQKASTKHVKITATPSSSPKTTSSANQKTNSNQPKNPSLPYNTRNSPKDRIVISPDGFKHLKKIADEAINTRKTFMMRARWAIVRKTFRDRGWIELFESHHQSETSGVCNVKHETVLESLPKRITNESDANYTIRCERYCLSRLIEHVPVALTWSWVPNKTDFDHQLRYPEMLVNKLLESPFGKKEVLARDLQSNNIWLTEPNLVEVNFPRSFSSSEPIDMFDFLQNFRKTACIGFLKFIVEKSSHGSLKFLFGNHSRPEIPFSALEFALQRCYEIVNEQNHKDIDIERTNLVSDREWDRFLGHHIVLTRENGQIQIDRIRSIEPIVRNAEMLIDSIEVSWPDYKVDGCHNIWIVKPDHKMCGNGIVLSNSLSKIRSVVGMERSKRFIVQKYIERPLLIYNTKFDIRQYFLITNVFPLSIWMYKESYLRFSTQPYDLHDFKESIHITNNAIQRKYHVSPKRDDRLPRQNMWDCHAFRTYLAKIGRANMWQDHIYPGMKRGIIGTVLASQYRMIQRDNTFQLYGADFMLCEDFKPWLIEVNVCPDLFLTTNVTERMAPRCVDDLLKVVIDRRRDPTADTGHFELIYEQTYPFSNTTLTNHKLIAKGTLLTNFRKDMFNSSQTDRPELGGAFIPFVPTAKSIYNEPPLTSNSPNRFIDITVPDNNLTTPEKLEGVRLNLKQVARGS